MASGRADSLLVTIAIVRCTVRNVGLIVSATRQMLGQTENLSLQKLCGVLPVLWGLLSVQQGSSCGRLTVGNYRNYAAYLLYFRTNCQCKMINGRAE